MLKKDKINITNFRKSLRSKKILLGAWMQISNPDLTELMCNSKFSWIAFDMEHGSFAINDLPNLFRAAELNNKLTFVRLPNKEMYICSQVLDAGCAGIIIPNIKNKKELELLIKNCYLPPLGKRGVGYSRSNVYGKNFEDFKKQKEKPIIVAMIENINAVNKLDEILSVKGLDAILIGPYDLSASMGITGKFDNLKFIKAIKKIESMSKKSKIPLGIHVVEPGIQKVKKFLKSGYRFIPYCTDAVLINSAIKKSFEK